MRTTPRYVVYNNVHIESKESDSNDSGSKGKPYISDAMRFASGVLAEIGIFGIALKQLNASGDAFHTLDVQTMVSEPRFHDLIHQYQSWKATDLAKQLLNEICSRFRTNERGIPSDAGITLVPEELLHHMSWIPGILFADLCELMARSSDRSPLTLLTTLQSVIVPNILSKKK